MPRRTAQKPHLINRNGCVAGDLALQQGRDEEEYPSWIFDRQAMRSQRKDPQPFGLSSDERLLPGIGYSGDARFHQRVERVRPLTNPLLMFPPQVATRLNTAKDDRNRRRIMDKHQGDNKMIVEARFGRKRFSDVFENFASPFPENRENSP